MYAGADSTAVGLGLILPALEIRFVTTSDAVVICGGASSRFAIVDGIAPTEVIGLEPALSAIIGFGTTVEGLGTEVEGENSRTGTGFIVRAAL